MTNQENFDHVLESLISEMQALGLKIWEIKEDWMDLEKRGVIGESQGRVGCYDVIVLYMDSLVKYMEFAKLDMSFCVNRIKSCI